MATNKKSHKTIAEIFPGLKAMDAEPTTVCNRFTGVGIVLEPMQIALYDYIMGCEMAQAWGEVERGLAWFRKNNSEAYMVLLD